MDDAGCVSSGECTCNLRGDIERFAELHRCFPHAFAQRHAINEFSGDEIHRVDLLDLVNRDDVWMIQRGSSLRFLYEATYAIVAYNIGGTDVMTPDRNWYVNQCMAVYYGAYSITGVPDREGLRIVVGEPDR